MEAYKMGIYEEDDLPAIRRIIRILHQAPDPESTEEEDKGPSFIEEENPTYPRIVWE
jgi:hypothetical protein